MFREAFVVVLELDQGGVSCDEPTSTQQHQAFGTFHVDLDEINAG
jgi:hypothetical protein